MKSLYKAFAKGLSRTNTPPPASIFKSNNKIPDGFKTLGKTALVAMVFISIINISQAQNGQKYSSAGNALSNGDVLGSTNNQPVIFISNDEEVFRISPNGSAVFKNDIKLKGGLQITDFAGSGFRLLKVNDDGTLSVLTATNNQSDVLTGAGIFTPFATLFQKQWNERFNGSSDNFLAQDGHFYPMSSLSQFSWNLKGNEGVDPNEFFLGNKDARDLSIRTKNHERLRVLSTGEVQISAPDNTNTFALDVAGNAHIGGWLYVDNGVVISQKIEGDEIKTRNLELLATSEILGKAHFVNDAEIMERVSIGDNLFNIDPKYRLSINGAAEVKGDLNTGSISSGNINAYSIHASENISADKLIINKLISQNEIEFGNGGTIYHIPGGNGNIEKYGFGVVPIAEPYSAPAYCGNQSLQNTPIYQFGGYIKIQNYNPDLNNDANANLIGHDGVNGLIDVLGGDVNGAEPKLFLNYYCGKNTVIGGPNGGGLTVFHDLTVYENQTVNGNSTLNTATITDLTTNTLTIPGDNTLNKVLMNDGTGKAVWSTVKESQWVPFDTGINYTGKVGINTNGLIGALSISQANGLDKGLTISHANVTTHFYNVGTVNNQDINAGAIQVMASESWATPVLGTSPYSLFLQPEGGDIRIGKYDEVNGNESNLFVDGKVGINTNSLFGKLTVAGTSEFENGIVFSQGNVISSLYNTSSGGSNAGAIQVKAYDQYNTLQPYNLFLQPEGGDIRIGKYDEVNGNESNLFVDGKIAIGTNAPHSDNKLEVVNSIGLWSGSASYSARGQLEQNGVAMYIGENIYHDGGWKKFQNDLGTSQIRLYNDYNGIQFFTGTSSESAEGTAKFIIKQNGATRIKASAESEFGFTITNTENDGSGLLIKSGCTSCNDYYAIAVQNNNDVVNFKVSQKGIVHAREVIINNDTWGDYVFAPDYSLMGLRELENYFTINHHLPEIPSADEIKASGIPIGEMQKLHMVKIEELTLYLIAQDKRIKDLEERNNKMQEQILLMENK